MKTTHNVPLKALCLTLGVHFISYSRSENQKKRYFLLFFAHLIVTLSLRLLVRLHLGNAKEKRVFLLYSARFALTLYPKYEKDEETLY